MTTDVPLNYPVDELPLGQWVQKQRESYAEGTLPENKHILLEEKNFIFEPNTNVTRTLIHETWKRNFKELQQFKRDNGHLEVRQDASYCTSGAKKLFVLTYTYFLHSGPNRLQSHQCISGLRSLDWETKRRLQAK